MDESALDQRLKELQVANLEAELKSKEPSVLRWLNANPVVVAAAVTALATVVVSVAASCVTIISAREQRSIEEKSNAAKLNYEFVKSEFEFMLQAIKAENAEEAAENLHFLVATGIIQRPELRSDILKFLEARKPNRGPRLPATPK